MFIKNMSPRERYIALGTIVFLAIVFVYSFILDPIFHSWQALNDEILSKSVTLKKDVSMMAARKSIEADYEKFAKYVKSDRGEEGSVAEVLTYLEDLSRKDSCNILNIKPVGSKDYAGYKEVLVDLSADGSLAQFTKFMYDIENTKNMILKIKHFALTSKAGQEGALKATFLIAKVVIE